MDEKSHQADITSKSFL